MLLLCLKALFSSLAFPLHNLTSWLISIALTEPSTYAKLADHQVEQMIMQKEGETALHFYLGWPTCHNLPMTVLVLKVNVLPPVKSFSSVQFSSVTQLCPTFWSLMDCSMPGFLVHHQLPELAQIHLHRVGDDIQPSHPLSALLLLPSIFPSIRVFSMSHFFASGGQSIGVSTSASVLPMNIQDLSPLGLTDLISLQSKGLSRVFSNTTVKKHQFCGTYTQWRITQPWKRIHLNQF